MYANRFLRRHFYHSDLLTLKYYRGVYWFWDGRRWIQKSNDAVRAQVTLNLGDHVSQVTCTTINSVMAFIQAETITPDTTEMPSWLDGKLGYSIAFSNGIVTLDDLMSGKANCLRPHSPAWFSPTVLPYEFQPEAQCPIWNEMLEKNLESDAERRDVLQEFAGYCLQYSTEFHAMLMLTGDGGNGKSCVLAGITGMLGADNVSNLSLDELAEKFKLPRILGKLANICADMPDTSRTCEGTLKKLISGDPMTFELKYQHSFSAVSTAKLNLQYEHASTVL